MAPAPGARAPLTETVDSLAELDACVRLEALAVPACVWEYDRALEAARGGAPLVPRPEPVRARAAGPDAWELGMLPEVVARPGGARRHAEAPLRDLEPGAEARQALASGAARPVEPLLDAPQVPLNAARPVEARQAPGSAADDAHKLLLGNGIGPDMLTPQQLALPQSQSPATQQRTVAMYAPSMAAATGKSTSQPQGMAQSPGQRGSPTRRRRPQVQRFHLRDSTRACGHWG